VKSPRHAPSRSIPGLALLALGVVYGDIGTSPLYAVRETFNPAHGIALTPQNIVGGASTIFWLLMVVVSLKYVTLVVRADNRGEGGMMALVALATQSVQKRPQWTRVLVVTGLLGAALFYGDAVLTPAISVLSALEGLAVRAPAVGPYLVPIAVGILIALFLLQRRGSGFVGLLFGPVCLCWFFCIALAGAWNIALSPSILAALDPLHALAFVTGHGVASFVVLGSVLLVITGAEALYADIGHFGKDAVRISWFAVVAPALVLNYLGQAALLIADRGALANPFYLSFPRWALYPMVALATAATIIASQATISGAYSMTRQAIQLGFLPRMRVDHTSARTVGQVYVPAVNWILLFAVTAAVVAFGSSTKLASAYGIAVMGTMWITTLLAFFVTRYGWGYPVWLCVLATAFFLSIDSTLFAAALAKIRAGGWFPLSLALGAFVVMTTWRRGRELVLERLRHESVPVRPFIESLAHQPLNRVPGTAAYLGSSADRVPHALLHTLKHFRTLHERIVLLTVEFAELTRVPEGERLSCERVAPDFWRVRVRYGFMERVDVMAALDRCAGAGLELRPLEMSFFIARERPVPTRQHAAMAYWREALFATMAHNATRLTDYFRIPAKRVIEIGARVEM
jgi:KUP system potassium uptake protein